MADKRVVRLRNPQNPNKPFVRVANRARGVQWASCNSTGGMGRGRGGGGGGGSPQSVREVHLVFRDYVPMSAQDDIRANIARLRQAANAMFAGGGGLTIASVALIAAGFVPGVIGVGAGLVFLFGGMVTLTFAEFAEFAAYETIVYVRFTTPCGSGDNEGV